MTDSTRVQGGLICAVVLGLGALFALGLLRESYWALAIPVAAIVVFALGLAFWVGWTIATIRVEPEALEPEAADQTETRPAGGESA